MRDIADSANSSFLRAQFGQRTLRDDDLDLLLSGLGDAPRERRLSLALRLLFASGLRASELLAARFSHLERLPLDDGHAWLLHVVGKGAKVRSVPVPDDLLAQAQGMARWRGAVVDLGAEALPDTPLVGRVADKLGRLIEDPDAPLSYAAFADELREHAAGVARSLHAQGYTAQADRLSRVSAHWLRHTHATRALDAGVDLTVVQENLGHASLATTSVYVSAAERKRAEQMRRLWSAKSGT